MYDRTQFDGAQRAKGRVHFRQGVKQLYSDSAVYNDRTAKFEAFGNVRFVQGDTVDIRGNYLRYDGQAQVAYMTGHDVTLKHTRGTLVSDSVLYNVQQEVAEFFKGGKLTRGDVTLTAEHGKCFMRTDSAHFDNNVKLTSARGTITTNDMGYNMKTKWAHVMGPSNIIRKNKGFGNHRQDFFDFPPVFKSVRRRYAFDSLQTVKFFLLDMGKPLKNRKDLHAPPLPKIIAKLVYLIPATLADFTRPGRNGHNRERKPHAFFQRFKFFIEN